MAWEKRERGGLYYTRSRKEDGRVIREYVGCGEFAQQAARTDAVIQRHREAKATKEKIERECVEDLCTPVLEMCEAVQTLCHAVLIVSGYRREQGKWRMRRESGNSEPTSANQRETGRATDALE